MGERELMQPMATDNTREQQPGSPDLYRETSSDRRLALAPLVTRSPAGFREAMARGWAHTARARRRGREKVLRLRVGVHVFL